MNARTAPRVLAQARRTLQESGILKNPYLEALRNNTLTLEEFRGSQERFYFAVSFFPRPLAALLSRLSDPKDRLDILHNLVEEHGEFSEPGFHQNTFKRFLRSVGSEPETLDSLGPGPAARAFNSVLYAACALEEPELGIACLGLIELAFAPISGLIGGTVVRRGWVRPEELAHYSLHAEIDQRHAEELFLVLEPRWDDAARRRAILEGLELGAYAFDRLYRDLLGRAGPRTPKGSRTGRPILPIMI